MEHETRIERMGPEEIQERSFSIIRKELEEMGIRLNPKEEQIIVRAIHTTADFDYGKNLVFSPNAVETGIWTLKLGAVILTDTNMAKVGINKKKLEGLGGEVFCFMADQDVARIAKERGCTRAAVSMEKAAEWFGRKPEQKEQQKGRRPVIAVVGNAPTALIRLYELMEEGGFLPDLIIGAPVGFVNVVPAKELILRQEKVPYIIARGRKGGSNVAAAIVNALLTMI